MADLRGVVLPYIYHPGTQPDEWFMQFTTDAELETLKQNSPWRTLRIGEPETDDIAGNVHPLFVKKQEVFGARGGLEIVDMVILARHPSLTPDISFGAAKSVLDSLAKAVYLAGGVLYYDPKNDAWPVKVSSLQASAVAIVIEQNGWEIVRVLSYDESDVHFLAD